jgi:hypothetical protein
MYMGITLLAFSPSRLVLVTLVTHPLLRFDHYRVLLLPTLLLIVSHRNSLLEVFALLVELPLRFPRTPRLLIPFRLFAIVTNRPNTVFGYLPMEPTGV